MNSCRFLRVSDESEGDEERKRNGVIIHEDMWSDKDAVGEEDDGGN